MAKVVVVLDGMGGPLDKKEVEYQPGNDPGEALSLAVHDAIEPWILSAGDTIKIREAGWREDQE